MEVPDRCYPAPLQPIWQSSWSKHTISWNLCLCHTFDERLTSSIDWCKQSLASCAFIKWDTQPMRDPYNGATDNWHCCQAKMGLNSEELGWRFWLQIRSWSVALTTQNVFREWCQCRITIWHAKTFVMQVELVEPPAESKPGDRVFAAGFEGDPVAVLKKEAFDGIAAGLKTNDDLVACFNNISLQTNQGPCKVRTLAQAEIH